MRQAPDRLARIVEADETFDVDSLELIRPRSVGVEHVGLWAMEQLGLRTLFEELGMGASMTRRDSFIELNLIYSF